MFYRKRIESLELKVKELEREVTDLKRQVERGRYVPSHPASDFNRFQPLSIWTAIDLIMAHLDIRLKWDVGQDGRWRIEK